jgi:AP2-associated kinase
MPPPPHPNHHHHHHHQPPPPQPPPPRPPPPLLGKTVQVGAHLVRVERHLSSGGYADVYRCTDGATGHPFALKHLRLDGDAGHVAGAQREAKAMARLRGHPCVLRLHAVAFAGPRGAETDGFFLLDLCPGTLIEAMHAAAFRLPEPAVIEAFACVAHAVAHMHAQRPLPLAHR